MISIIKFIIVLIASLIAAYTDYKTGYIYDWLTYPFIAIGFIFLFISNNILIGLIQFTIIFVLGLLFYKFGKIGGGDLKYLLGIPLYFPLYNGYPLILFLLLFACLFSIIFYGIYYLIFLIKNKDKEIFKIILICLFLAILFSVGILFLFNWIVSVISLFLLFIFFFVILSKDKILNKVYKQKIKFSKVLNDDLIDLNSIIVKHKNLKIKNANDMYPLDKKTYALLKDNLNANELVFVYKNLPIFAPFLFFGFIASVLFLNYFHLLILV